LEVKARHARTAIMRKIKMYKTDAGSQNFGS
jgi:hypothetical protein